MLVPKKKINRGFTLVELLVTITIFVVLTGVVLFNQAKFNSSILLTNLAYDTALTVRQAQTYGINIKEFAGMAEFVPYGVHFERNNPTSFILFADLEYDKSTDELAKIVHSYEGETASCNNDDGCVNRYNIKRGNFISDICVVETVDCEGVDKLDIIFKRPNPDAYIFIDGVNTKKYKKATITLSGADGSKRVVNVQSNGLISIVH